MFINSHEVYKNILQIFVRHTNSRIFNFNGKFYVAIDFFARGSIVVDLTEFVILTTEFRHVTFDFDLLDLLQDHANDDILALIRKLDSIW